MNEKQAVPRIRILDGYRGVAVLLIVGAHIIGSAQWVPSDLDLRALRYSLFFSVEVLFIVSGFVAFLPVVVRGRFGDWRSYALRRTARIVPAYLISLAATLVVGALLGHEDLPFGVLPELGAHLVFLQHPFNVSGFGVNAVYWVLSLLVTFWVLLPFVANRYLRHPLVGLGCALVIVLGWRLLFQDELGYVHFIQFPLFVGDFAFGMTAAWLYVRLTRAVSIERLSRYALLACAVLIPAIVSMLYVVGKQHMQREIFFFGESPAFALGIPAALALGLVAGTLLPRWAQWPLANSFASWVGQISYGVFIFHALVLAVAVDVLNVSGIAESTWDVVVLAAIVVPPSLLVGWLSYRFVEEPARAKAREWERPAGLPPKAPLPTGAPSAPG